LEIGGSAGLRKCLGFIIKREVEKDFSKAQESRSSNILGKRGEFLFGKEAAIHGRTFSRISGRRSQGTDILLIGSPERSVRIRAYRLCSNAEQQGRVPMHDLSVFGSRLKKCPEGYWTAGDSDAVSFPVNGHDACYSVEENSFWFRHRNAVITATLQRFPPRGAVFDIGGGNGYVAAGFAPQTLPAVGLFDVLEHVEDDRAFLRDLHSVMKPSGRIYITVPAYQALWSLDDDQAGHYRRYSRKQLAALLERAGFTVEYLTHFFWLLPVPILPFRTIPSRIGTRRSFSVRQTRREHSAEGAAG
jgi:hypothetical protein